MKTSTSPDPDGFTVPFYKMFWDDLNDLIMSALLEMFDLGAIPDAFNPRPDGVWRVTRPDGGWPKGPPPYVSSKVRVVEYKSKRRWKDLVELYRIRLCRPYFLTCDVT